MKSLDSPITWGVVLPPVAEWAILQLRDVAPDAIPVSEIQEDLTARWPQLECRFPAVKQNLLDRENPLSSYVFVKAAKPPGSSLERSPYVSRLLRDKDTRQLQTVSESELQAIMPRASLPKVGSAIRVTCGDWEGLEGVVVSRNCTSVTALIELWSRARTITLQSNEFATV